MAVWSFFSRQLVWRWVVPSITLAPVVIELVAWLW